MDPEANFERRFGGIARLYGADAPARLHEAHVCVVGIGGVGSWAVEALARSGVGRLTLIDLDHLAESNINRQIHAVDTTLGQAKVLAMAERIADINPRCDVVTLEEFASQENIAGLLPACNMVIDAIDQVSAKAAMIAYCRAAALPIVTTGAAGGRTDPTRIVVGDLSGTTQDALASSVRARLRREYGFTREPRKKFGIECVYSTEPMLRPGIVDDHPNANATSRGPQGLSCAGYGSSVAVTAAFGLVAAGRTLDLLTRARRDAR